jgi:hypothetical protein
VEVKGYEILVEGVEVLKLYGVSFQAKQLRPVRREPEGRTELNNLSRDVCVCVCVCMYVCIYVCVCYTEVTLLGGMFSREGLLDTRLHCVTVCI